MAALDTNFLVRWLVEDDSKQLALVRKYLEEADEPFFIPTTVLLELEWVLRSRYNLSRGDVMNALTALTASPELEMQDGSVIARALWFFSEADSRYDFADCLHLSETLSAKKEPFLTFDVKASQLPGALLVGGAE